MQPVDEKILVKIPLILEPEDDRPDDTCLVAVLQFN